MTFLNIYIAFSLLVFVLLLMQSYMVTKKIKREHPDDVDKLKKKSKRLFRNNILIHKDIYYLLRSNYKHTYFLRHIV